MLLSYSASLDRAEVNLSSKQSYSGNQVIFCKSDQVDKRPARVTDDLV